MKSESLFCTQRLIFGLFLYTHQCMLVRSFFCFLLIYFLCWLVSSWSGAVYPNPNDSFNVSSLFIWFFCYLVCEFRIKVFIPNPPDLCLTKKKYCSLDILFANDSLFLNESLRWISVSHSQVVSHSLPLVAVERKWLHIQMISITNFMIIRFCVDLYYMFICVLFL